jgi:hypothetical protein
MQGIYSNAANTRYYNKQIHATKQTGKSGIPWETDRHEIMFMDNQDVMVTCNGY